jgi:hypothetical protein
MEKGLNDDVLIDGRRFHVQTEDWGRENPFIVTRVFLNGAVVKTIKRDREKIILQGGRKESDTIRLAIESQHLEILDFLGGSQLSELNIK